MNAIFAHSSEEAIWSRQGTAPQAPALSPARRPTRHRRRGASTSRVEDSQESARADPSTTDEEIIARLRAGDTAAFELLMNRHRQRAHQLALGLMRNEHDAQEIVQEAFLRAYTGLDRFRGASSFFTWLHRIVFNLSIDAKRHPYKHRIDWESIADCADDTRSWDLPRMRDSDPQEILLRSELNSRLGAALSRLNPFHRTVIEMRELEGMSYQEMAECLRISKGTVMSRLFHARRRLQQGLTICDVE